MNTQYEPKSKERQYYVRFISDNEALAKQEIELMLESVEECRVTSIEVVKSKRICSNAHGTEIGEDKFDSMDASAEEAWFDDYDFVFKVNINTPATSNEEEIHKLLEQAGLEIQDGFEE